MTSKNQRIRILSRKVKTSDKMTTMEYHGKLYFAEKVRRPVTRGSFMMITDVKLPITTFDEDDFWWIAQYSKQRRGEDNMERLTAVFDRADSEHQARLSEILESLEEELRHAGKLHFSMSGGDKQ
jgi:hypothetical protein